jgi:hypothetical protein
VRRFLFLVIMLTFFILGGLYFATPERKASSQEDPYRLLCRIMQLAEAQVTEGELHYWASLGSCPEITSLPDLEARADVLLERISSREPLRKSANEEDFAAAPGTATTSTAAGAGPATENGVPGSMLVERQRELNSGGQLRLLLQRMEQEDDNVVHLLVTITRKGEAPALGSLAHRLPGLIGQETKEGNLSLCLTGHLAGKMDAAAMEALAQQVAQEIGGEELQCVSDGRMVSVTGYTPDLGNYLRAENLRINLNLALRYDEYLDKTVIWAGTPLIARSY